MLSVYLPPLLLKLSSKYEAVREKVISVVSHVQSRAARSSILLPIKDLARTYSDSDDTQVKTITMVFVSMLSDKYPQDDLLEVSRLLISDFYRITWPYLRAAVLDNICTILTLMEAFKESVAIPSETRYRQFYQFEQKPEDESLIKNWACQIMLLRPSHNAFFESPQVQSRTFKSFGGVSPAFLPILLKNGEKKWTSPELRNLKLAWLHFAECCMDEKHAAQLYLMASIDPNEQVASEGNARLKRLALDFEDPSTIENVFKTHLKGNTDLPQGTVNLDLQTSILTLLCKSTLAANSFDLLGAAIYHWEKAPTFNVKHREAIVRFAKQMVTFAKPSFFNHERVTQILSMMVRLLEELKGDSIRKSDVAIVALRSQLYDTFALTAKHYGEARGTGWVFELMLDWLAEETIEVRKGVEASMSRLIPQIQSLPSENVGQFLAFLENQLKFRPPHCRHIIIRYVVAAAPYENVMARLLCIAVIDNESSVNTIEEAKRGLDSYTFRIISQDRQRNSGQKDLVYPSFEEFMQLVKSRKSPLGRSGFSFSSEPSKSCLEECIRFCRLLLVCRISTISQFPEVDEQFQIHLEQSITIDEEFRHAFRASLAYQTSEFADSLKEYCLLLIDGRSSVPLTSELTARYLLELLMFDGKTTFQIMQKNWHDLSQIAFADRPQIREIGAHMTGLMLTNDNTPPSLAKECYKNSLHHIGESQRAIFNVYHGSLLIVGYLVSRLCLLRPMDNLPHEEIRRAVSTITDVLQNDKTTLIAEACMKTIRELSRGGAFENVEGETLLEPIWEVLQKFLKDGNDLAIECAGQISLAITPSGSFHTRIFETLYSLHDTKQTGFMFTIGQAMSCLAYGKDSRYLVQFQDVEDRRKDTESKQNPEIVLDRIFSECGTTKPSLRKAVCVWLLCLLQYHPHVSDQHKLLERFHTAFICFLGDRDDIVQESASRGLSLVYERGNDRLRGDLIHNLVHVFTSDQDQPSTVSGSVGQETELFQPGTMRNQEGSSISTYKDVLNLATEVGDPSLVYRFMSLAKNSKLWSTRQGAAFGLGSVISKTTMIQFFEKDPAMLKRLIPKLYRYRFDVNGKAMDQIWTAIVPNPNQVVNEYFNIILDDLLENMGVRQWRVRQASCAAIGELLIGQPLEKYEQKLEDIWSAAFRCLDDIKESVREAAMTLSSTLIKTLVQNIDIHTTGSKKNSTKLLQQVMPFLLGTSGIQSSSQEMASFAMDTIFKICDKAGERLRPYVPDLVDELVTLLTTSEPAIMNYLHLNARNYNVSEGAIDSTRLIAIKHSPILAAIERCIDQLDDETMEKLSSRLVELLRKAIGMPSKAGLANILVSLVVRRKETVRPHADQISKAVMRSLLDRNETIAKAYATALGYLCRISSDSQSLKMMRSLEEQFENSEQEVVQTAISYAFSAMAKHASDKFNMFASDVLPFVYMNSHDPTPGECSELLLQTWRENTGGSGALKLYLSEICTLCSRQLSSNRWRTKQCAALTIADLCKSLGNDVSAQLSTVRPVLVKALEGRAWKGKETVLEAFVQMLVHSRTFWEGERSDLDAMYQLLLREVRRDVREYNLPSLLCLQTFEREYWSVLDCFTDAQSVTLKYLEQTGVTSEDEKEQDKLDAKTPPKVNILELTSIGVLAAACRPNSKPEMANVLEHIEKAHDKAQKLPAYRQLSQSLEVLLDHFAVTFPNGEMMQYESVIKKSQSLLFAWATNVNFESLRIDAVKCINRFKALLSRTEKLARQVDALRQQAVDKEKSSIVLQQWSS